MLIILREGSVFGCYHLFTRHAFQDSGVLMMYLSSCT